MKKLKMLFQNIMFLMNNDLRDNQERKRKVPFDEIRYKPSKAERERLKTLNNG